MTAIISYNGIQFGPRSKVTVNEQMIYDDADRTVIFTKFNIRVEGIVTSTGGTGIGTTTSSTTNSAALMRLNMSTVRAMLEKAGCALIIKHDGFGPEIRINDGPIRDVKFGPKPKVLGWNPVGNDSMVEVAWEVEAVVPYGMQYDNVRFAGLSAFNYSADYHIDDAGWTTRRIAGYLEIANNRLSSNYRANGYRMLSDTADDYRELLQIGKPANFRRESDFSLSLDKTRLTFTIVDEEIKSREPFPQGVIEIKARHETGWDRRNIAWLPNRLVCSIHLAANEKKIRAWEIFRSIYRARIFTALEADRSVFLESIHISEEIFEDKIDFAVSYRILGELSELLDLTDVFQPLGIFGDWSYWDDSMKAIQSPRGTAGMLHHKEDDVIVDLFMNDPIPNGTIDTNVLGQNEYEKLTFCNEKPDPEKSWVRFDATLDYVESRQDVLQITMGADDITDQEFDPANPFPSMPTQDGSSQISRFTESVARNMEWIWRGYAERLGYDIPVPNKLKIGGVTLVKIDGTVRRKKIGTFFCQPLYGASWVMRYRVETIESQSRSEESNPAYNPGG